MSGVSCSSLNQYLSHIHVLSRRIKASLLPPTLLHAGLMKKPSSPLSIMHRFPALGPAWPSTIAYANLHCDESNESFQGLHILDTAARERLDAAAQPTEPGGRAGETLSSFPPLLLLSLRVGGTGCF